MTPTQKTKNKPNVIQGLASLERNPKYQSLPLEKKQAVRAHVYDKYVEPYLKSKGVDTSGDFKGNWVNKTQHKALSDSPVLPVQRGIVKLGIAGAKMMQGVYSVEKDVVNAIANKDEFIQKHQFTKKLLRDFNLQADDRITRYKGLEGEGRKWLGDHYNTTWQAKAVELPGTVADIGVKHGREIGAVALASETVGLSQGLLKELPLSEKLLSIGGAKGKFIYNAVKDAAEGYVFSKVSGDKQAKGDATAFAVGGAGLRFLGKMLAYGGSKLLSKSVNAVASSSKEAIESASTEKISGATVKASAKMLNDVAQKMGFEDFWQAQASGRSSEVVRGVAVLAAKANESMGAQVPELVTKQVEHEVKEVAASPLGAEFLGMLKQHGSDPIKDVVDDVVEGASAKVTASPGHLQYSSVGAAAANSLEFSDNLSKLIKTNVVFEKRTHKYLAALSLLMDQGEAGQKLSPLDNRMFDALVRHIRDDPDYKDLTLNQLKEAGDNVHKHIHAVLKEGTGDKRIFRQTEFRPHESPYSHQRELQRKTNLVAGAKFKVGDRARIGGFKGVVTVVEADAKFSKVRLKTGKIVMASNDDLFSEDMSKVDIAREYAERRAQAGKE